MAPTILWEHGWTTGQVLLLGVLALITYGFHPVARWQYRHIPGPFGWWYLGSLVEIVKLGQYKAVQNWAQKYGPVFKLIQGSRAVVVVEDPDLGRLVNLRNSERMPIPSVMAGKEAEFDSSSILTSSGLYHRSIRNAWQPMFFTGSLEAYVALMNSATDVLLHGLDAAAQQGRVVDIWRMFGEMTMHVVGTTAFGVELHTQAGDVARSPEEAELGGKLIDAAKLLFEGTGIFGSIWVLLTFLFPFLRPLTTRLAMAYPDAKLRELLAARHLMIDTVAKLIQDTRAQQAADAARTGHTGMDTSGDAVAPGQTSKAESAGVEDSAQKLQAPYTRPSPKEAAMSPGLAWSDGGRLMEKLAQSAPPTPERPHKGVAPGSFLHLLMRAQKKTDGQPFSDLELANQAFSFLLAGYETTASALGYTVYCLSGNPDKQAKLLREIDQVVGSRKPTFADLDKLPYLDAVFKESLRLYPPAGVTVRVAKEDMNLGGYHVAKGTWLQVAIYSMHHNPKYWQGDPEAFIPERFVEGTPEASARQTHAWQPFGDGPRACIGLRFATEEAKIALIRIYQRFVFELAPFQQPLQLLNRLTISPKHGILVTPVPRA
ncbi:hypothetical protein WJX72_011843 [[Myrmecia] bisecta]|uniref:Cytochrome P450 n=1 Tax=[Myrmecia] bisecta TaxID=41462 RepID=A0AAW1QGS7_9CHLO